MYHETITPRTDPVNLDDCGKQVLRIVTPDTENLNAWVEIIYAQSSDDLSENARKLCKDYGIEADYIDGFGIWDYLDGQILDYHTLRAADGTILEVHLLVGYGGPNIWEHIDERGNCETRVYWWGTTGRGETQHELYAMIFECMREMIDCT